MQKAKTAIRLLKKSYEIAKTGDIKELFIKTKKYIKRRFSNDYQTWMNNHKITPAMYAQMAEEAKNFSYKPIFSIIMPVYNVDGIWLQKAIDSVLDQVYENWELCIVDDASTKSHIKPILQEYSQKDSRIKVQFNKNNQHISLTSNDCIKIATGEFLAFLDNDDELANEALYEVAKVLNENKDLDFIYSDEDLITVDGERVSPIFKPDWSPESTMSQMYTTHLGVYRKSLVEKIGGLRKGYEGSQDYDLVLRLTEQTDKIYHIDKILYHWRIIPGSTTMGYSEKNYARTAAMKALKDAMERRNIQGDVLQGSVSASFRVKRNIIGNPKIAIIIPTKNMKDLVKTCIESIEKKTTYKNYEIILVDNNSDDPESIKYFNELANANRVKLLKYPHPFNYSAINNFAVRNTDAEHVVLLNNDTEVIRGEWLSAMLEFSQLPDIGAVGAKLDYPDGTIQHAGIIVGLGGVAAHSHRFLDAKEHGYMTRISNISNVSAVTGACLMVKKSLYEEVGGLEEKDLTVAYNDLDFCLKLLDKGYRNIYTPYAELYHYESKSRGQEDTPEKLARFEKEKEYIRNKWMKYIEHDPYYNVNLTRDREDFSIRTY